MSNENPYAAKETRPATIDSELEFEPPQSVTFVPKKEDIMKVYEEVRNQSPSLKSHVRTKQRNLFIQMIVFSIVAIVFFVSSNGDSELGVISAAVAFALGFSIYRLPGNTKRASKKLARNLLENESSSLLSTPMKITLQAGGFEVVTEDGHSFAKWSSVPDVQRLSGLLLLFVTPTSAQGVPSSAFVDELSFNAYSELAEGLWNQAQ